MRLSTRRKHGSSLTLSMTSMIDVVFLLLIFFIVTTTFVRPERQIQSAIIVNEKGESKDTSNLEPAIVQVSRSNDRTMFQIGAVKTNDLSEIKRLLEQFENKSDGAFVRAAPDVPFESAAQAIGVCNAAGFASVAYLPSE